LSNKIKTSLLSNLRCNGFDGDYDYHAAGEIWREAHRSIKRISDFMRSHYTPPSGVCSRRIGPADAMVIAVTVGQKTTQNTTFS
jgi:hypothetical protein